MARSILDALVTEKTLSLISRSSAAAIVDLVADGSPAVVLSHPDELPLKNVCAKVAPQLSDKIDEVCGLLGISKRRFLEAAFIEAVQKAEAIMEAEGLWEALSDDNRITAVETQPEGENA